MYASYRVPYSIDPYADDNVGTEQMPEHAYPQTDVTAQDQQEALTQKTNVIDDFLRQLAMHIAGGTGIISRPPGADLLARDNASSDTSPPSSDDDAEEAGDRHNVPEDKQTPEEIPDPPQENKAHVISPELRNEIDRVKGIKPDAVGNALRDSLAEKNTGAGTSPYGLAKPGEGMDFSVHSEVPAQTLYGDDYRVQMTGSYDDYPGIEFLDTPQGKNGMPAGTTIVKKSSGISLFKNVRDSLPKYQSTVDNMQSRDVYQIVANYELEDGKRVSNELAPN